MQRVGRFMAVAVAASMVSLAGVGSAFADGLRSFKDDPGPRRDRGDWSGLYIGVSGGWMGGDMTFDVPNSVPNQTDPNPFDADGGLLGGFIGLQGQFGSLVLGLEGGFYGGVDTEGSATCPTAANTCNAGLSSLATVGGKLGFAFSNVLIYASGGYANAGLESSATLPGGARVSQLDERHDGYYVGGGLDFLITPNLVFGIDYRHYDFDAATHDAPGLIDDRNISYEADSVSARLTFLLK